MTEERKVQLGVAVDATGAKEGFDQVKQGARDMAQAVGQAGQTAGKGMDAIGEGGARAADRMTREEGRIRASIQRATLDLQTLGKSASEKLEAKINLQGLDAAKFAPYLTALKQAEEAQRRLKAAAEATAAVPVSFNEFTAQRIAPTTQRFVDQGLPNKEAQEAALRQLTLEWQQYKAAGVAAQTAVGAKTATTTTALAAEANAVSRLTTSLGATSFINLDRVGTSLGAAAAKADEATASVHRLQREIELTGQLAGARTSFGAAVGPAVPAGSLREAIERRGTPTLDPRLAGGAASVTALADAAGKAKPQVDALGRSQDGLGMSTKQLNFALRQVPAQVTDIVVSLQSGQRPMQVLLQQGGQLKDLFGGVGPAARALGGYVLGLVNPFTVAAAAVGVLAYQLYRAEQAARGLNTLQAQLAGTGRAGMFTDSGLKEFIAELSLAPGVTRETATAIVSEMSKAHDIAAPMLKDLARLAVDYAKATGTDVPAAMKTLTSAIAEPDKGFKQLDEALGNRFSSNAQIAIDKATKLGDTLTAQKTLFSEVASRVKGLADNAMTPLQKSTNDLGNSWGEAMRKLDQSGPANAANTAATAANTAAVTAETAAHTAASAAIAAASTSSATALAAMTAAATSAAAALSAVAASSAASGGGSIVGALLGGGGSSVGSALPGLSGAIDGVPYLFAEGGYTGKHDPRKPVGVVHGDEYVFSAPAVRALGVDRLERLHQKAKNRQLEEEDLPGYSSGGLVAMFGSSLRAPAVQRSTTTPVTAAGPVTYIVQVQATPGMSREAAMNQGRDIQRGMQTTAARRGRNI